MRWHPLKDVRVLDTELFEDASTFFKIDKAVGDELKRNTHNSYEGALHQLRTFVNGRVTFEHHYDVLNARIEEAQKTAGKAPLSVIRTIRSALASRVSHIKGNLQLSAVALGGWGKKHVTNSVTPFSKRMVKPFAGRLFAHNHVKLALLYDEDA